MFVAHSIIDEEVRFESATPYYFPAQRSSEQLAKAILAIVMRFRRMAGEELCNSAVCSPCFSPHLERVREAIETQKPILFVLPAFPGKSPNTRKVLGNLPDMAEQLSLEFLNGLCERIRGIYSPGVEIMICSDGRVFSDVVGMPEEDVSAYQKEIAEIIERSGLNSLSLFNLEDVYGGSEFGNMREVLMKELGVPLEELRKKIQNGTLASGSAEDQEATRMYRGITRFLFEDSLVEGQTKSRTALQKEARIKAYEVIRRSNAWSELIAERFPSAVRLSIHPQVCGSKKLGLRLIANESWMTPWHGVAVETEDGFVLLKRSEAESLGAELVHNTDGRPSHFKLAGRLNLLAGEIA